ncbi:MAG: NUDIX domain-containing protein [Dehalococcoidia bacterium]
MSAITRVRNSAKAIVIVENRLLTIHLRTERLGDFFMLPGGGQQPGESLHQALQRECREEIGTTVTIHELCFVRDYVGRNHDFSPADADLHLVELMFRCDLDDPARLGEGILPDDHQVGLAWLDLERLDRFYPAGLRPLLRGGLAGAPPRYLGDLA